ncbi:MAG: RecQ family zinc-binding domain-containing protein, partial [Dysgonamonadaceae bacterium]|nr:RecQ family zinc-binding domain-containing protein [Dysgonamonadaceae bacterium]
RIILEYFGEKNIQDCGKCDICIEKSKLNGNNNKEKEKFAQIILNLLKSNKRTVQEIIENSPLTEKQITGTLRFLQDSKQIKMENNYIEKI